PADERAKDGMATGLKQVLAWYARLPESERRPPVVNGKERPNAAPPPGGLVLTVYDRPLVRDPTGQDRIPHKGELGSLAVGRGAQRDSLWLTDAERKSLIPQNLREGEHYLVPSSLARRILLFGLSPHAVWVVEQRWEPDAVRVGQLKLTVETVSE